MKEITAHKISKKYGQYLIFRRVEARFTDGVHGIAGPNGSGKSTLMKCLSGLIRPDRGSVQWKMQDTELAAGLRYLHMGFSAPYIRLYPELSCAENLRLILQLSSNAAGVQPAEAASEKDIAPLLAAIGLEGYGSRWYGQLSSGQQQRMRLAAALVKKPAFLLLDEPGTNLDAAGFRLIEQIVGRARRHQQLLLLASNESRELDLCDTTIDVSSWKPG